MTCNVIYKLFVKSDSNKIYVCSLKLQYTIYAVYLMVILIWQFDDFYFIAKFNVRQH